ncbi:MAG: helical backbone metal receptor [Methanocorpusculum sp.]|nr:helical backbone metal receptor [Methanocorpusculum sp.]
MLLLIAGFCGSAAASETYVQTAIDSGLDYIAAAQKTDGGFADSGALESSISVTWFTVTAITAADENPLDWKVNGNSPLDYYRELNDDSDGTGELAKKITLLVQFGIDPHNYNGHDCVADLKSKIKSDGRGGDYVYTTYWTIFGLTAAGEDASKSVAWLKTQQQSDGGFGSYGKEYGDVSDSDNTAASIMALIAGGVSPDDTVIKKAVQFLRDVQESSGGYNYGYYSQSNLASTAWVIQALCAAGVDPSTVTKNGVSPVDYLLSLQREDGSFKYTEYTVDSPVGMTARAVTALTGKPYPVLIGQSGYDVKSTGSTVSTVSPTQVSTTDPVQSDSSWTAVTVTDDFGYTAVISKKPQRIISLAPANTEILFALGAGDSVVGVTEYCNYPEEVKTKSIIGGYSTVNIERVVTLQPDLIVAYYGNGVDTVERLRSFGYTVLCLNSDTIEGTYKDIALLGTATGNSTKADEIIASMKSRISAVTDKLSAVSYTPSVAHCMWVDPLWVSGSSTFQDEMFTIAGGHNAFSDVSGWGIVNLEKFYTTDPEIIIVDSGMGMGAGGTDVLKNSFYNDARLSNLTAVKNNHVYVINADIMDRGGPRIVDCIETLAAILHPDLFEMPVTAVPTQSPGFSGLPLIAALVCAACLCLFINRRGR